MYHNSNAISVDLCSHSILLHFLYHCLNFVNSATGLSKHLQENVDKILGLVIMFTFVTGHQLLSVAQRDVYHWELSLVWEKSRRTISQFLQELSLLWDFMWLDIFLMKMVNL
jgi:hypothetical protein